MDFHSVGRQVPLGFLGPFDRHHGLAIEVFIYPQMAELSMRFQPVEVGMDQQEAPHVAMNQNKGRTADGTGRDLQADGDPTYKRSFPRPKFSMQRDDLSPAQ
jgi:hypothetical protein